MPSGRVGPSWGVGLLLAALAGCVGSREQLTEALKPPAAPTRTTLEAEQLYRVRPSDTLSLQVPHPGWSGQYTVPPEGRLALGEAIVRVDGLTAEQIARAVAGPAGLLPEQVLVRVTGYHSQKVYLFG